MVSVVLTVCLVPGIQMGPPDMVEYMTGAHFNPVPMAVYSSASTISLDTT